MNETRIELTIRREGHADMTVPLPQGSIHIGRAEDNGLVLPDIAVSRRHARLSVVGGGVSIEDVGSGNGTYFQGKPIRKRDLHDGDEVLIDPFTLVFSVPQQEAEVESTESPATEEPPPRVAGVARLVLVHGHGLKPEYPLREGGLSMGRSEQRDVILPDPAASRSHAEVVRVGEDWLLRDFGSVNGTYVNARRVREHILADGDRIRIGQTELAFQLPQAQGREDRGAAQAPPPAPSPGTHPFENLIADLDGDEPAVFGVQGPGDLPTSGDQTLVPYRKASASAPPPSQATPPAAPPTAVRSSAPESKSPPPRLAPPPPPAAPPAPRAVAPAPIIAGPQAPPPSYAAPPPAAPLPLPPAAPFAPPPSPPFVAAPAATPFVPAISPVPVAPPPPAAYGAAPAAPQHPSYGAAPAPPPVAYAPPSYGASIAAPPPSAPSPFSAPVSAAFAPPPRSSMAPPPSGGPALAPPPPASMGFAPNTAPAPGGASQGGFGHVEMEVGAGAKRGRGRKMKMSGGGGRGGKAQGTFMERNIRRMIGGIALAATMLLVIGVVSRTLGDTPSVKRTAPDPEAGATAVDPAGEDDANQVAVEQLLNQGNAYFAEKKYFEAVEKYADVQRLSPSNATATKMGYHACEFLVVQSIYTALSQRSVTAAQAQESYQQAMTLAEQALANRGSVRDALAALEPLQASFPDDTALQDAITRLRSRERGAVVAARERAKEAHVASIQDLFAAAQSDRSRGDAKAAIQGFERVLAADPEKKTELFWKAEEQIRQIKSELAARGREAYRRGLAASKSGDYLTARKEFNETIRLDPYNEVAPRKLEEVQQKLDQLAQKFWSEAEIYEKTNQIDMAVGRYRKVQEYSASSSSPLAVKAAKHIDALMQ